MLIRSSFHFRDVFGEAVPGHRDERCCRSWRWMFRRRLWYRFLGGKFCRRYPDGSTSRTRISTILDIHQHSCDHRFEYTDQ